MCQLLWLGAWRGLWQAQLCWWAQAQVLSPQALLWWWLVRLWWWQVLGLLVAAKQEGSLLVRCLAGSAVLCEAKASVILQGMHTACPSGWVDSSAVLASQPSMHMLMVSPWTHCQ